MCLLNDKSYVIIENLNMSELVLTLTTYIYDNLIFLELWWQKPSVSCQLFQQMMILYNAPQIKL